MEPVMEKIKLLCNRLWRKQNITGSLWGKPERPHNGLKIPHSTVGGPNTSVGDFVVYKGVAHTFASVTPMWSFISVYIKGLQMWTTRNSQKN